MQWLKMRNGRRKQRPYEIPTHNEINLHNNTTRCGAFRSTRRTSILLLPIWN